MQGSGKPPVKPLRGKLHGQRAEAHSAMDSDSVPQGASDAQQAHRGVAASIGVQGDQHTTDQAGVLTECACTHACSTS